MGFLKSMQNFLGAEKRNEEYNNILDAIVMLTGKAIDEMVEEKRNNKEPLLFNHLEIIRKVDPLWRKHPVTENTFGPWEDWILQSAMAKFLQLKENGEAECIATDLPWLGRFEKMPGYNPHGSN